MPCTGCGAKRRATQHRAAVSRPTTQQPFPWPREIAASLGGAVRELRRASLHARTWLATQPRGPQQWASQSDLRWFENMAIQAEQRILRAGAGGDA